MKENETECSRLKQRSVIKFPVAEKSTPYEIYRRIYDVYGDKYFSQKKFTNRLHIVLPR